MLEIRTDDLSGEPTRHLLALHLMGMTASSPPGHVFALDLSGLQAPEVTVWSAWIDDRIAAVGALKMRTHPDHLRKGAAKALLRHILQQARTRGLKRVGLETGSGPSFEPALALYRAHGFEDGPPFAEYVKSGFNQFLHLTL
jgi:putative acetyltransferase